MAAILKTRRQGPLTDLNFLSTAVGKRMDGVDGGRGQGQPRSQGLSLPAPKRERERPWERGWGQGLWGARRLTGEMRESKI